MSSPAAALALSPDLGPHAPYDPCAQIAQAFETHRHQFTYAAYKILHSREDADDVVQDAMIAACEHIGRFRGESSLTTWLTRIVINRAYMLLRHRCGKYSQAVYEAKPIDSISVPSVAPDAASLLLAGELDDQVNHAVASLPLKYRSAIALWMCTDGPACLSGAQKTHKFRAIALLKQRLKQRLACVPTGSVVG